MTDLDTDPLPSPSLALLVLLNHAIEFHAPDSWITWSAVVIIAVLCLFTSAFVSGSEIAYFGLTPSQIDSLEESDDPKARRAFSLISDSERLLATILITNNLVNITMVVLLTFAISKTVIFNNEIVNFLLQTVFLTFLLLLFGEIFPKLVARGRTVRWVVATSPAVGALYSVFGPLARMMVRSSSLVNKIVTKKEEKISTDELEKALEISNIKEGQEKDMLEGILSFGEKEAGAIMISRIDVTAIEYHDSMEKAMKVVRESGFSRIPVYDRSQDSIRGILYSKDMLPYIGRSGSDFKWQSLLRKPYFVPESRMIDDLLEDFRRRKIHIAIVIDEYGGTKGIVTLEDIIEEIVGEIDDEYDESRAHYRQIAPDSYIFDGKIAISDFCRDLEIPQEELGDIGEAETIAGLLLELKGDFPTTKETLSRGRCDFQAIKIERHRITRVKVTLKETQSKTDE